MVTGQFFFLKTYDHGGWAVCLFTRRMMCLRGLSRENSTKSRPSLCCQSGLRGPQCAQSTLRCATRVGSHVDSEGRSSSHVPTDMFRYASVAWSVAGETRDHAKTRKSKGSNGTSTNTSTSRSHIRSTRRCGHRKSLMFQRRVAETFPNSLGTSEDS